MGPFASHGLRYAIQLGTIGPIMIEPFDDIAPSGSELTDYDTRHIKLYLRVHDAHEDDADWTEAVWIIFGIDPNREPDRAGQVYDSHLARARWMIESGYRHLIKDTQH
jgi:hypothetical protein